MGVDAGQRYAVEALIAGLLWCAACWPAAAAPIVLVDNGRPRSVVVMPADPQRFEKLARDELILFIGRMCGATLPVVTAGRGGHPEGMVRILIGRAAIDELADLQIERALGERRDLMSCRDGYVVRAADNTIALAGVRHTGTVYAVYDLLERFGYRWLFAGELGEVVPRRRHVAVEPFETVQTPSFEMRTLSPAIYWGGAGLNLDRGQDVMDWLRRNRLSLDYDIAVQSLRPRVDLANTDHADAMARQLSLEIEESPKTRLLQLTASSHARVADEQMVGLREPWHGAQQFSDPVYRFYNRVVEQVDDRHPGRLYGLVVHLTEAQPPKTLRPHRAIVPAISFASPCPRHPPGTGRCWKRDVLLDVIRSWGRATDNLIIYDAASGFDSGTCVPLPLVSRIRREYPAWHRAGVRGRYCYTKLSAMNNGPNVYIRARLFWNAYADTDALLDDYFNKLFGPASGPARSYWNGLEQLMQSGPGHFSSEEIIKVIYPIDQVRRLEKHILEAERRVTFELLQRRVRMLRYSFENLMLYLRMRQAEDEARFAEAAKLARRLWIMHEEIETFDPYVYKIGDQGRNGENFPNMTLGWAEHLRTRHELTDGTTGERVAPLPEEWSFRTDVHDMGITYRWFEPAHDARFWKPIRTTRFWDLQVHEDDTGGDYDGAGWYRTCFDVPARFAGREIKLNFAGVAGEMLVWVNGRFAGRRPSRYGRWPNPPHPFVDLDLTGVVETGTDNVIVIRVHSPSRMGGIYRRVLLWSPTGGG